MSRGFKIVVVLLLLLAVASTGAFAQAKDPLPAYLLSIFLGFGTGHFYMHDSAAVKFLILDASAVVVLIAGSIIEVASAASWLASPSWVAGQFPAGVYIGYGMVIVGALAITGFRVWQVIDIFRVAGKSTGKVSMLPALSLAPEGDVAYGLTLRYSF
jgi:hypothetical protein